jgi:hypothetical protein
VWHDPCGAGALAREKPFMNLPTPPHQMRSTPEPDNYHKKLSTRQ